MRLSRGSGIEIKTPGQFAAMREAGLVVGRTLSVVASAAEPGISTRELDAIAAKVIREAGAMPSFLGYHGYPAPICTSPTFATRGSLTYSTASRCSFI